MLGAAPSCVLGSTASLSRPRTHGGNSLTMLAHVTFHNSNSTSAIDWVNYNSVLTTLEEMETGYTAFQRIDVTVDSNPINAFVWPLRRWAAERQLRRVRLRVSLHSRLPHPFLLAWAHREHMERAVLSGRYDWFFYTEADVFVPSVAMRVQVELALKLYAQTQLLLGFARVSNDTHNQQFYSDIRKSAAPAARFEVAGLGTFVHPTYTYGAAWAYPRAIMRDWLENRTGWNFTAGKVVRERAGWGWTKTINPVHSRSIVLCDACHSGPERYTAASLLVVHVGKSGRFFVRVRRHNTLPVAALVLPDAPAGVGRRLLRGRPPPY